MTTNEIETLPVFVYGTLRPGCGLWRFVEPAVERVESAVLHGAALRAFRGAAFPYATLAPGRPTSAGEIRGELLHLRPDQFADVLDHLDRIEGYVPGRRDNHYVRTIVHVYANDTVVQAWTYLASPSTARRIATMPVVPDGDWVAFTARPARAELIKEES